MYISTSNGRYCRKGGIPYDYRFFSNRYIVSTAHCGSPLTGKRQIGELEPIELVLTMLLSDLASVPMQDFGIPLINGVIPIITLLAMSMLLSCLSLRVCAFAH